MSVSNIREHIVITDKAGFKNFLETSCKERKYDIYTVSKGIDKCEVKGDFTFKRGLNIRLIDQVLSFEGIEFNERVTIESVKVSQISFSKCTFHKGFSIDNYVRATVSECKFDTQNDFCWKSLSFYYDTEITFEKCDFNGIEARYEKYDAIGQGSIYCSYRSTASFNNCTFTDCMNITNLNQDDPGISFTNCDFKHSSFFTNNESVDLKNTKLKIESCRFKNSSLLILDTVQDVEPAWSGEDTYESSVTLVKRKTIKPIKDFE